MPDAITAFTGNIPENYERHLRPVLFEPYAIELAARLHPRAGARVLEIACGTGVLTRRLLGRLPADARLVATDLNPDMLERARRAVPADPRLEWRTADALTLPFPDASFDAVFCQFGVMFFPDRVRGLREMLRVLAPGGRMFYNSWDSLPANPPFARLHARLAELFPADPPQFLTVPHGYHDPARIRADAEAAGLPNPGVKSVELELVAESADSLAAGMTTGTPLFGFLESRGADFAALRRDFEALLAREYGDRPLRATMRAWVVEAGG